MHALLQHILQGGRPDLEEFLQLGAAFPLLLELEKTPQDPVWHAEGNVRVHTSRVLKEVYRALDDEAEALAPGQKLALVLGAVFHDIAKPVTTREQVFDGIVRIIAPRHPEQGRSHLAYKLMGLGLPHPVVLDVLALVGHHHDPRKLVKSSAAGGRYWQLSSLCNPALLYPLALADIRGREAADHREQLEIVELYRLFAEEHRAWTPDPYAAWREPLEAELGRGTLADLVMGEARADHAAGLISTPEEALARSYRFRRGFGELVVMCGPSGSGKSTWIAKNLPDHATVSLDELREEIAGRRADQSMNGRVQQAAREQLKAHLREHKKVVWDATNLRHDFRAPILELGRRYGAATTLVVFQAPEAEFFANNRARAHAVPENVLARQLGMLEFPYLSEAHRTVFVGAKGLELQKFGFSSSQGPG